MKYEVKTPETGEALTETSIPSELDGKKHLLERAYRSLKDLIPCLHEMDVVYRGQEYKLSDVIDTEPTP